MTGYWSRWTVAGAAVAVAAIYAVPAEAEWGLCAQMQADFIAVDRAAGNAATGNPDRLAQQVDSARSAARRAGCQRFLFFGPPPSRDCPAIMARLDQLERAYADAGGSGGGGGGFFFGFGRQSVTARRSQLRDQLLAYGCTVPESVSGSYRTLCVRTCDGYYFPISYATSRSRFKTDAAVCQSLYPPGAADLYVHHTTGEDATAAVSAATGEPLASQSFAFAYRSSYDKTCAALFRAQPGQSPAISFSRPPVPEAVVAASLVTPAAPQRRGRQAKVPDAAATGEMPADLDPGVKSTEATDGVDVAGGGVRRVGPAYYYEPSYLASTGGEPPKLAKPDVPDPPAMSAATPAVAASILPNPFDLFRRHKPSPPPEPDADPTD
jgi:hypothetical protein